MEKSKSDLLADLFQAYFDTRKHKRGSRSQLSFEFEFESQLIELCERIHTRTYVPGRAICFITDVPVKREIFASPFSHRVVCRLLYNYIAPLFEARMIYDSYSCRVGKGVLQGIQRLEHHLRSCTRNYTLSAHVLKMDLRGYFMSIDRRLMQQVLREGLDAHWHKPSPNGQRWCERLDRKLIDYLIEVILYRNPAKNCIRLGSPSDWDGLPASKSLFHAPENVGLAIGDITSQLFSNIFMDRFDQYVKRELGCRHYGRYVDDFYVVHSSRAYLRGLIGQLEFFLRKELRLTVHPDKIVLRPADYGVAFLGAYVKPYRRYACDSSVVRFHRKMGRLESECRRGGLSYGRLLQVRATVNSYCGHFCHFKARKMLHAQFVRSPIRNYFYFKSNFGKAVLVERFAPPWKMPFEQAPSATKTAGSASGGFSIGRHQIPNNI